MSREEKLRKLRKWLEGFCGENYRIIGIDPAVPGADKTVYTARNPDGKNYQLSQREFDRLMYAHCPPVSSPGMEGDNEKQRLVSRYRETPVPIPQRYFAPLPKPGNVYTVEVSYTLPSGILVTKRWRERA